jgi:hypothetical protein
VHTLCAQVIPCRDELLHIFACECCLLVHLPEQAREGTVSVFNIKNAQQTHIPIIIPFVYVGMGWVAMLLYHISSGQSPIRNHLARHHPLCPCCTHVVREWIAALSPSSHPSLSLTATSTSCCASGIESTHKEWLLLHWHYNLLDGGNLKWFALHKLLSSLGRGWRKRHCHHLCHDGDLVSQELVDCCSNLGGDDNGSCGGSTAHGCAAVAACVTVVTVLLSVLLVPSRML